MDILYNVFQSRITTGVDASECVKEFKAIITTIRDTLEDPPLTNPKKRKYDPVGLRRSAIEVCDILREQLTHRLESNCFLSSFTVVDPKYFTKYAISFPEDHVNTIVEKYSFIPKDNLSTELMALYRNKQFSVENTPTVIKLYKFLDTANLHSTFSATSQLINIVLTTPVSSAEPERCFSTLKRVKTSLRNTMGQSRLNALSVLTIHRDALPCMPLKILTQKLLTAWHV